MTAIAVTVNRDRGMDIELYDFNDHIESIEWIERLPKGLVSEKIDMRYNSVTITKLEDGVQVYVGPKDMDAGGDGILITLDNDFKLVDYVIERIEPMPFDDH